MGRITKGTAALVKCRIAEVKEMLMNGHPRGYIIRYGMETWKLGDRRLDEYVKQATAEIHEMAQASTEHNLGLISSNLWELYRHFKQTDSAGLAKETLLDLAKLHGLDNPELTLNVNSFPEVSDEELTKIAAGT